MGSPEALFANVTHQLLLYVVLAGKAWKCASCSKNKRKQGISEALPFTPVCHPLTLNIIECYPRGSYKTLLELNCEESLS